LGTFKYNFASEEKIIVVKTVMSQRSIPVNNLHGGHPSEPCDIRPGAPKGLMNSPKR
jgi:hypothetical protein